MPSRRQAKKRKLKRRDPMLKLAKRHASALEAYPLTYEEPEPKPPRPYYGSVLNERNPKPPS